MGKLKAAIFWAIAMLAVALGARLGWIGNEATTTLLIILPILAVMWIARRTDSHCTGEA